MLNLIGMAGGHAIGAGGLLALLVGLAVGGLGIVAATTKRKESGILRYTFGDAIDGGPAAGQFPSLLGGGAGVAGATIIVALGVEAEVTPDADDQTFGASPGHALVTGGLLTFFTGSNPAAVNTDTLAVDQARLRAASYIPRGTKLFAFFVETGTAGAGTGCVEVQTEVTQSTIRRAGVPDVGPLYLALIRIAVRNSSAATNTRSGVLIVELQHSEHDIPGNDAQSFAFGASAPPG